MFNADGSHKLLVFRYSHLGWFYLTPSLASALRCTDWKRHLFGRSKLWSSLLQLFNFLNVTGSGGAGARYDFEWFMMNEDRYNGLRNLSMHLDFITSGLLISLSL